MCDGDPAMVDQVGVDEREYPRAGRRKRLSADVRRRNRGLTRRAPAIGQTGRTGLVTAVISKQRQARGCDAHVQRRLLRAGVCDVDGTVSVDELFHGCRGVGNGWMKVGWEWSALRLGRSGTGPHEEKRSSSGTKAPLSCLPWPCPACQPAPAQHRRLGSETRHAAHCSAAVSAAHCICLGYNSKSRDKETLEL